MICCMGPQTGGCTRYEYQRDQSILESVILEHKEEKGKQLVDGQDKKRGELVEVWDIGDEYEQEYLELRGSRDKEQARKVSRCLDDFDNDIKEFVAFKGKAGGSVKGMNFFTLLFSLLVEKGSVLMEDLRPSSQKAKVTNLDVKESRAPLKQKEIGKIFLIKKVLNLNGSSGNCLHHLPSRYKVSLAHRKDPLRIQAICAAVQEGSLPVSALVDELRQDSSIDEVAVVFDDDDNNEGRKGSKDDENIKVQYHYTLFHMTFTLA
ncbi:hypothetical protein PPACK8108_LOCUS9716 [Phakopsora pachyrhizi]|uniref:Uncharacterized protein n=1 Tax=Phakopsora pachyrhizi TaxID=170000 RepID=A0AAV0AWZ6_PHAPC|nr:hypothetical protein PPACK8108_LOCUS9716 [Phakopsora pachyrhizi]